MYCRYIRVFGSCNKMAADWQLELSQVVTNTMAKVYQYVIHADGINISEINNCYSYSTGHRDHPT